MQSFVRLHPRLFVATAIGIAAYFVLRHSQGPLMAGLFAWNAGCWSWNVMLGIMMTGRAASDHEARDEEDIAAWLVLIFVCTAAAASLAAIVLELTGAREGKGAIHYLLAGGTVAGSWFSVGLAFTSHYAHMFFASDPARRPLRFPDEEATPQYWDFLYFAFTISVAAQTSDVSVMRTDMRRIVAIHSVLGFLFNAAIIGFSINVFAGAIGR